MQTIPTTRYTGTAIVLHWLMAVLIFAQIGIGLYMVDIPKRTPPVAFYYNLHKSLGLLALALVALRLWWRARHPAPPVSGLSLLEAKAAQVAHRLLYACMVLTPACGLASSSFSKFGVHFFGYKLSGLGWEDPLLHAAFKTMHAGFSYLLCALIALHVLAAIWHAAISGVPVIRRMLPGQFHFLKKETP